MTCDRLNCYVEDNKGNVSAICGSKVFPIGVTGG